LNPATLEAILIYLFPMEILVVFQTTRRYYGKHWLWEVELLEREGMIFRDIVC
jgi:hypothetical protein